MSNQRDFLGSFQLVRLIRSGTTTQVWEARRQDGREREKLALKVLNREYRNDKNEILYLQHEAEVGKMLDHPNIIKVYDFHTIYQLPFLSMQLFNSRNLKVEMRERPDEMGINLPAIIRKAAEGVRHLHEKGWIHCDIKPDNFLADEQGDVKLIDFSIAEKPRKKSGLLSGLKSKKKKVIRGTRSYMAPEQIRGKGMDERSDIYSFGCVIFELLAGRAPFTATNPDELLNKHLSAPVPNLLAVSGATRDLTGLVTRMMAKKPKDRPQSIQDFLFEFSGMAVFRAGKRPAGLLRDTGAD
ncbi:MAG: serine/threonine protein kinase [Mariniblastus sp.]|nr:serine/threonine protein kinase [Mariniblastus sp.]